MFLSPNLLACYELFLKLINLLVHSQARSGFKKSEKVYSINPTEWESQLLAYCRQIFIVYLWQRKLVGAGLAHPM